MQTFFLKNVNDANQFNDLQTALRNVATHARIYGVATENAIVVSASQEDLETIKELVADLDRPVKAYRVTYTVSRVDGAKRTAARQYSMTALENEAANLKKGNRVPIVTGSFGEDKQSGAERQFQYLDVGVRIRCIVTGTAVKTKFELTSVSEEKSNVGIQDSIIGQTMTENDSLFVAGKAQVIGAIEDPGTNQHEEIEVRVEPL